MGKRERLVVELNVIARTNISDIEKKRRMNELMDKYEKELRNDIILSVVAEFSNKYANKSVNEVSK